MRFARAATIYEGGGSTAHCTKSASVAAAKCYITAENSLNFEEMAQKSCFVDIFESKHSKV